MNRQEEVINEHNKIMGRWREYLQDMSRVDINHEETGEGAQNMTRRSGDSNRST